MVTAKRVCFYCIFKASFYCIFKDRLHFQRPSEFLQHFQRPFPFLMFPKDRFLFFDIFWWWQQSEFVSTAFSKRVSTAFSKTVCIFKDQASFYCIFKDRFRLSKHHKKHCLHRRQVMRLGPKNKACQLCGGTAVVHLPPMPRYLLEVFLGDGSLAEGVQRSEDGCAEPSDQVGLRWRIVDTELTRGQLWRKEDVMEEKQRNASFFCGEHGCFYVGNRTVGGNFIGALTVSDTRCLFSLFIIKQEQLKTVKKRFVAI